MVGARKLSKEDGFMAKLLAALLILASFLFAAPVLESGTSGSTQFFQAIGTADAGGGGGE